jgi:opacity protein-like surface antigen
LNLNEGRLLRTAASRYSAFTVACLFIIVFLTVLPAEGEWYVVAQTGVILPGSLSNATVNSPTLAGGVTEARVSDIDMEKASPFYGAKAGFFFPKREWFGLETEAFTSQLNIKQQTVVGGVPGKVFAETMPGAHMQLTTWAINAIVRSPSLVAELEPYGGIGPALFFSTSGDTNVSLGVNLIAGARYFVTPQLALFGEFKYNRATLRTDTVQGDYSSQIFVFGLSLHFDRPLPTSSR